MCYCLQLLFTTVHLWSADNDFTLRGFWILLSHFSTDTLDLVLLSILRFASLSGLAYIGSSLAWSEGVTKERVQEKVRAGKVQPNTDVYTNGKPQTNGGTVGNSNPSVGVREPLLPKKDLKTAKHPTTIYEEWFSGSSKKDVLLFVVFLLCTVFQV